MGKLKLESSRTAEVLSSAQTGPSLLAMAKSNGCARYKTINSLDLESRGVYQLGQEQGLGCIKFVPPSLVPC